MAKPDSGGIKTSQSFEGFYEDVAPIPPDDLKLLQDLDGKFTGPVGKGGPETVRKKFLMIRYLGQYLDLFKSFETLYRLHYRD